MLEISQRACQLLKRNFNKTFFLNVLVFCGLFASSFSTITMEEQQDKWPKNLASLRLKELNDLQRYCSRMVEYEDLMLERTSWTKRLHNVEIFQKKLYEQQQDKTPPINEDVKDFNGESYKIRRIYINHKNPHLLDLHGVSSAKEAKDKVLQFIRAAKSKRKNEVIVITGKGNHVNHRGSKGVLFNSFPKWLEKNENIIDFKVRKDGGSYMVFLTPPCNNLDFDLLCYLHRLKGSARYIYKLLGTENLKYIKKPFLAQKITVFNSIVDKVFDIPTKTIKRKKGKKTDFFILKKSDFPSLKYDTLTDFPTIVRPNEAKEYLNKLCKSQKKEPPQYRLIPKFNPSMKTAVITIKDWGSYSHQVKSKGGYQKILAQAVYKRITGVSIPKKQAKDLLQRTCQEKFYGIPKYQILEKAFKVKVSIGNLAQEEISYISQADAEDSAAKKMYEFLIKK